MEKHALIIASGAYQDSEYLKPLNKTTTDAEGLAAVLQVQELAAFDSVETLVNKSYSEVNLAVHGFYRNRDKDDLLLLYFCGHGVRGEEGDLYLTLVDTQFKGLEASAIDCADLRKYMERSRSKRLLVVLDCCFSGAFEGSRSAVSLLAEDAKNNLSSNYISDFDPALKQGRFVMTATEKTSLAYERSEGRNESPYSIFSEALIKGLGSEPAQDADGDITVQSLYNKILPQVLNHTDGKQRPQLISCAGDGDLLLIKSKLKPIPQELSQLLMSSDAEDRERGLIKLRRLCDDDASYIHGAISILESLVADRDSYVQKEAKALRKVLETALQTIESHKSPPATKKRRSSYSASEDTARETNNQEKSESGTDIDSYPIREAIENCEASLQADILQAWNAPNNIKAAVDNIIKKIHEGNTGEVIGPFYLPFERAYATRKENPRVLGQIKALVEAVSLACVVPGEAYKPGKKQTVATRMAWLLRMRLLAARNLPLCGIASKKGQYIDDEKTHAFITKGMVAESEPKQRLWELISQLVERFDPSWDEPPEPSDEIEFEEYCDRLDSRLALIQKGEDLFFHLMKKSESDEVIQLLFTYLPRLMSFLGQRAKGSPEGLLVDNENDLGGWIALWFYRAEQELPGGGRSKQDNQGPTTNSTDTAPSKNETEKPQVKPTKSNEQSVSVKTGDNSPVTIIVGQDDAKQNIQQNMADPDAVLAKLEELLDASKESPDDTKQLKRAVRDLQSDIEDTNKVPSNMISRLQTAVKGLEASKKIVSIVASIAKTCGVSL